MADPELRREAAAMLVILLYSATELDENGDEIEGQHLGLAEALYANLPQ
jgi:hypothetical protein